MGKAQPDIQTWVMEISFYKKDKDYDSDVYTDRTSYSWEFNVRASNEHDARRKAFNRGMEATNVKQITRIVVKEIR